MSLHFATSHNRISITSKTLCGSEPQSVHYPACQTATNQKNTDTIQNKKYQFGLKTLYMHIAYCLKAPTIKRPFQLTKQLT